MWPSRKKEKKGIKLAPGESMEIGFSTSWRKDKDEVMIMTDAGPVVLDGKNELFIEVGGDNIDPIKVQVIPDFKKRTINLVEVIDPNAEKKFSDKDGPRLKFAGSTVIKERDMTISDYLNNWDRQMEQLEKVIKRSKIIRNIVIPINIIAFFLNLYLFITKSDTFRYVNLAVAILCVYMVYYAWSSHKKVYKDYLEYKDLREKAFGLVKEK